MRIIINHQIKYCGDSIYSVKFDAKGCYIDNEGMENLKGTSCAFFASNLDDLQKIIEGEKIKLEKEFKNELLLANFKKNILNYGYSRRLAIKEVMESGSLVGFHYDLMGCAIIERINAKSLTIEDICNRKHYITVDYLNLLHLEQFFVCDKE